MLSSSTHLQLRARAELERRRRGLVGVSPFSRYQLDPARYISERLGWQPWDGQRRVLDAYTESLRAQIARQGAGGDGPPPPNIIRVESGHTIGKTTMAAGITSHFFDCFRPGVVYCFAPNAEQINDLLFKEIRKQRSGKGLPGRVLLTPEIKDTGDHFVKGRATNNAGGQGTERVQGQHEQHQLFVIDEAEGVDDYVFDAIGSMTSGGIAIVLALANPRTRTSRFHKLAANRQCISFRISCLEHPNVVTGRAVIPGAIMRDYIETMIDNGSEQHCEVVLAHDPDAHTFELPYRPGVIYRPDAEFLFRVLGIAPAHLADNTFVPPGRYEAAKARTASGTRPDTARIGVDVARYGQDSGTVYVRHAGRLWCAARLDGQDTNAYHRAVRKLALELRDLGVTSLHVRVDGGGGYGGGLIDALKTDSELLWAFEDFQTLEVHFNATPNDTDRYADLATELYAELAQALHVITLDRPPNALEADLCERRYTFVTVRGKDVKELESKKLFKARQKRSPDDGDGACLAAAPDRCFSQAARPWEPGQLQALSSGKKL